MGSTPWWRTASVYQLYIRSFADSNGDGIGDLRGIRERLPYIAALGVDAIWLNPCYPSPQVDHGYDVADYFDIEPAYGDLAEFDALIAAALDHGIRILMDVVPNHCSWDHSWFKAAIATGPGSRERERFYFRPGRGLSGELPPNNWVAMFGGSAWTRVTESDGRPGEWYLGVFTPAQPDFNWLCPDVYEHFDDMLRFWFDRGVDGFRADAVIHVGKATGMPDVELIDGEHPAPNPLYTWQEEAHAIWRHWRALVDRYEAEHPGRDLLLVAEAYTPDRPDLMLEYANAEQFHQAFAFDLMLAPWNAAVMRRVIDGTIRALGTADLLPAWTLNNHDTQRTPTRYGRADIADRTELFPGAIVNADVAIDNALGSQRARAAALLELALPGSVYLYAGEELGLPEVLDMADAARQDPVFHNTGGTTIGRDGCRIPLPWTVAEEGSHGFSSVGSAASWLPQPAGWGALAVEAQAVDAASFLAMYRVAGVYRKSSESLRSNAFEWVDAGLGDVLAFARGDVLVVMNVSRQDVELPSTVVGSRSIVASSVTGHVDRSVLPADSTLWLA